MALSTGEILETRYRIVSLLGQGGFGAVYRAWDLNLKQPCAIKENLDTTPQAQRQFEREAQILSGLHHPNLPRVTDHFVIQGQGQYLVMDFIEGQDLQQIIDQTGGPLPEAQVLSWIEQICNALDYLHQQNPPIIHRDIKPANIKITPNGRAMLVDFGIAKIYDPHLQTTVGAQAVTPGFSPFEQYGQGGITDPRTDIYALGATLYTLLTGQPPPESIQRANQDNLIAPHNINPSISASVEATILRSLELHPTGRYHQVGDFKSALHQTEPHPPETGVIDTRWDWLRRWWVAALLLGIAVIFLGTGTWGFITFFGETPTPTALASANTITPTPTLTLLTDMTPAVPSSSTPTSPQEASLTPSNTFTPSPTFSQTPTPSPSPTQTAPPEMPDTLTLRFGKERSWPGQPINSENVEQLDELGYWSFSDRVQRVRFSRDGNLMAAGIYNPGASLKGLVYLWTTQTGDKPEVIDTNTGGIDALDFANDGSHLAWGSWHGMVALYDLRSGKVVARPSSDGYSVNALAFSPDSTQFSWGRNNRVVERRNMDAGVNQILLSEVNNEDVLGIAYSPDGHTMAVGAAGVNAYLININVQSGAIETLNFGQKIRGIAYSPRGDKLGITGLDGKIVVYDFPGLTKQFETFVTAKVWDIVFSSDGEMIITADSNADVKFWSLPTGREVNNIHFPNIVTSLAITYDGKLLATGDWNGLVKLWGIP